MAHLAVCRFEFLRKQAETFEQVFKGFLRLYSLTINRIFNGLIQKFHVCEMLRDCQQEVNLFLRSKQNRFRREDFFDFLILFDIRHIFLNFGNEEIDTEIMADSCCLIFRENRDSGFVMNDTDALRICRHQDSVNGIGGEGFAAKRSWKQVSEEFRVDIVDDCIANHTRLPFLA